MDFDSIAQRILFEDNHVLIFNKPAGMPAQSDLSGDPSVVDILKDFVKERDFKPGNVFMGLVHRLDRPVSGIIVMAKTSKALSRLTELFRDRKVEKTYYALINGIPASLSDTLIHYHKKDSKHKIALLFPKEVPGSKKAVLHYKTLKSIQNISLLEVQLETGRFHQIRAQLFKIGHFIIGDLKYGAKKPNPDKSVCLHAGKISFIHPIKNEPINIVTPFPELLIWKEFI
jgi:23S rRNA pseudouridine1911/1915/1917 synthase